MKRNHRRNSTLKASLGDALVAAGVPSPEDIMWFEHTHGRKYAPLPSCKLRQLAKKAGFRSGAEYLRSHARHAKA